MKILILGNLGYIGPVLVKHLRRTFPESCLIGFDNAYFAACLLKDEVLPELNLNRQYYGDIRNISSEIFENEKFDVVIQLAAISNDPMGKTFERQALEINTHATEVTAKMAKKSGVKSFIFASSCSIYGIGGKKIKNESSELSPQTVYARSKIDSEIKLRNIADENFIITCLRFATACGLSPRMRLDLVLNDFVASAITNKKIEILSDGTPWRPLIDVKDMSRAIEWASSREADKGGCFLVVNVGADESNIQVRDLAYKVSEILGGIDVSINSDASPDTRSYKVDFSLFRELATGYLPELNLSDSINEIANKLARIKLDSDFRKSGWMRLVYLNNLLNKGLLDNQLRWVV